MTSPEPNSTALSGEARLRQRSRRIRNIWIGALGFAFIMLGLNAMRVGLLTRFMGILAIIVGVLFIQPLLGSQGVALQSFWLAVIGFVFILRWPGNRIPPAWISGKAEPWPSIAAGRAAKAGAGDASSTPAPSLPEPESNGSGDTAGQLRKKRKRKK